MAFAIGSCRLFRINVIELDCQPALAIDLVRACRLAVYLSSHTPIWLPVDGTPLPSRPRSKKDPISLPSTTFVYELIARPAIRDGDLARLQFSLRSIINRQPSDAEVWCVRQIAWARAWIRLDRDPETRARHRVVRCTGQERAPAVWGHRVRWPRLITE